MAHHFKYSGNSQASSNSDMRDALSDFPLQRSSSNSDMRDALSDFPSQKSESFRAPSIQEPSVQVPREKQALCLREVGSAIVITLLVVAAMIAIAYFAFGVTFSTASATVTPVTTSAAAVATTTESAADKIADKVVSFFKSSKK